MSVTRNNHYVPQWYQRQFFEPGRHKLAYLDMDPPRHDLGGERFVHGRSRFTWPTSQCFVQTDLYSTFFGTAVNDEIERRLFGAIDDRGSKAVRAFVGDEQAEWHRHFQSLFEFIDIQKIRTPKGLDWLRSRYPELDQNELMMEMQGIRNMHCTIWTEGVREIVSAEDARVKFIVSDHPVTIYNHAVSPDVALCAYPNDPDIALKASQTIFPLSRDFCLILTNLEYARDPACMPMQKRTFARNYRKSLVNTINFIRSRSLTDHEVQRINLILKSRARRFVGAGREEWLHPEAVVTEPWAELRDTLLPPKSGLFHFGGELYAKFEDGHVHYQDEFGRTEKAHEHLAKVPPERALRPGDACGCGSGKAFKNCCKTRPVDLRPSWNEMSIRERNQALYRGILDILGLNDNRDWAAARQAITDEKIRKVYILYQALWPLETDLLKLLPKPDGRPRAIYTGSIHPELITEFAQGASLYFGELLVEHPFTHPTGIAKEYSPVENPKAYHLEFIYSVVLFLNIMPLVDLGLVNLIPDPGNFDFHLREQTMRMAQARYAGAELNPKDEPRLERTFFSDFRRQVMGMPREYLERHLKRDFPETDADGVEEMFRGIEVLRRTDPLAPLVEDIFGGGSRGGQLRIMKMAPNFEMAMYLAQATGAAIVTDSPMRWKELCLALRPRGTPMVANLSALASAIQSQTFLFPEDSIDIAELAFNGILSAYPSLMAEVSRYLSAILTRGTKPNWEASAAARFTRIHRAGQAALAKQNVTGATGRITCAFPAGGIQDNTVNRLLLMSSSEHHLPNVPMAFLIEGSASPEVGLGNAILAHPAAKPAA